MSVYLITDAAACTDSMEKDQNCMPGTEQELSVRMRRYQKKQCIETIDLMEEAHGEIIRYAEKKQIEKAASLLEQCQQSAIGIGTLVEADGEEGAEAIHCLEEYCEKVYQFHVRLCQGDSGNSRQMIKKLRKTLMRAANCLQYGVRTQLEAVFLPYKASMWDSMESVWKAADEDSGCHAIVIPIPYYDRNQDGSFRRMHYEAELFPPDVPVVSYDTYDFEARHPDMIFIHNPYDDENIVTSVPPFFYSINLKQYTDDLIYIPYFIHEEIIPSHQAAIHRMERFCILPGVIHADHVILQSEVIRKAYVDVLVKYTDEKLRSHWMDKILGLGSPKMDRVCSLQQDDVQLPEAWVKQIQKEDGSRRKVILYNTSLSMLLEKGEAVLDKLEWVFGFFQENREEVVLLWRPHPLMEATFASMRPQLMERYRRIVEAYRTEGWGIYDDSADMYTAIAASDGYYGDKSSVAELYQKTGKPVMLQNVDVC